MRTTCKSKKCMMPKVDLPEIKGNHRKFRTLVSSYIGKQNWTLNMHSFKVIFDIYEKVCLLIMYILWIVFVQILNFWILMMVTFWYWPISNRTHLLIYRLQYYALRHTHIYNKKTNICTWTQLYSQYISMLNMSNRFRNVFRSIGRVHVMIGFNIYVSGLCVWLFVLRVFASLVFIILFGQPVINSNTVRICSLFCWFDFRRRCIFTLFVWWICRIHLMQISDNSPMYLIIQKYINKRHPLLWIRTIFVFIS